MQHLAQGADRGDGMDTLAIFFYMRYGYCQPPQFSELKVN